MAKATTPDFINPKVNPKMVQPGYTKKLQTTLFINNKNYDTFYDSQKGYYYNDANGKKQFINDKDLIKSLSKNNPVCIKYDAPSTKSTASTQQQTTETKSVPTYNPDNGNGGGYAATVQAQVPEVNKIDWQNKSIDEMASILGIENYKMADILSLYNAATNKKFDELDTQVKRAQSENLRALEGNYEQYLNQLREGRANAVSNGITKGAAAAAQLANMIVNAQTVSDGQQTYYDTLYDIAQQRGTALEENAVTAYKDRQAIEQYLGSLRGTYEANSVNELAARLGATSQVEAARLQADATTKAAGINAAATRAAATAQSDKMMQYYIDLNGGDYSKALPQYLNATARADILNSANNALNGGHITTNTYNDILSRYHYN